MGSDLENGRLPLVSFVLSFLNFRFIFGPMPCPSRQPILRNMRTPIVLEAGCNKSSRNRSVVFVGFAVDRTGARDS